MKNYAIPGLYKHYNLNIYFLDLLNKYPEYFVENLKINAIYGNFPFCTWDGGRIIFSDSQQAKREQIETLRNIYNDIYHIPMRFIFTNKLIEERDLYDKFNNLVLQLCENNLNEIVVNSPLLETYIKETYPKYSIISSTTKCITDPKQIIKELEAPAYKYICLDYNFNKNYKFLEKIPDKLKHKVELLVNPMCGAACKYRSTHYTLNSAYALNYGKPYTLASCVMNREGNIYPFKNNNVIITQQDIEHYYEKNNFINYKLEGRSFSENYAILNLVNWTVKPEYQLYVTSLLLNNIKKEY